MSFRNERRGRVAKMLVFSRIGLECFSINQSSLQLNKFILLIQQFLYLIYEKATSIITTYSIYFFWASNRKHKR